MKYKILFFFVIITIHLNSQIKKGIYSLPNESGFGGNYINVYSDSMLFHYSGGCLSSSVSFYKYKIDKLGKMDLVNIKDIEYSFITNIYLKDPDSTDLINDYNEDRVLIKSCIGKYFGDGFSYEIIDKDKIILETAHFNKINFLAFDSLNLKLGVSTINRFQKTPNYFSPNSINGKGNFLIIETTLPDEMIFHIHDIQLESSIIKNQTFFKCLNNVIYFDNLKYTFQKN